jgi:hypothetical protein
LLLVASPANAQTPEHFSASLAVADETGCVDQQALAREVEERLARPIFAPGATEAHLIVHVAPGAPPQATIQLLRADRTTVGTREIQVPAGCAGLRSALGLVVALLVDVPASEVRPIEPPPPPPPPPVPLVWLAEALATAARGALPGTAWGLGGGVRVARGAASIGLEAAYWPRSEATVGSDRSARISAAFAGLVACGAWPAGGTAQLGPCLDASVGRTSTGGLGFRENRSAAALRLDAGLALRATVWLGESVGLILGAGPVLTPSPIRLESDAFDGGRLGLFQGDRLWWRASAGVTVRFPSK